MKKTSMDRFWKCMFPVVQEVEVGEFAKGDLRSVRHLSRWCYICTDLGEVALTGAQNS